MFNFGAMSINTKGSESCDKCWACDVADMLLGSESYTHLCRFTDSGTLVEENWGVSKVMPMLVVG